MNVWVVGVDASWDSGVSTRFCWSSTVVSGDLVFSGAVGEVNVGWVSILASVESSGSGVDLSSGDFTFFGFGFRW